MPKPLKIGLTGGIGAGKSLVLQLLKNKGIPVLQTDVLGHVLLERKDLKSRLIRYFGKTILGPRNKIDRTKLGREVFQDPRKQKRINAITHPAIRREVLKWIGKKGKKGSSLVVVEVPLIFERGFYRSFDGVLSVSAPRELRRKRLLKRGWSPKEIRKREGSQWSQSRKDRMADWVIVNTKDRETLQYSVERWLAEIRSMEKE